MLCDANGVSQVRAMVEMLPKIDVVAEDAFNSSPTDPNLMGPDALLRFRDGQQLRATQIPTPLVRPHSRAPPHGAQ